MSTDSSIRFLWFLLAGLAAAACDDGPMRQSDCGNGLREYGEECDGADLGGRSCEDYGFSTGSLRCTDACTIETAACEGGPAPFCGDGIRQPDEFCDGGDLHEVTCVSYGFDFGELACTEFCQFDTSDCENTVIPDPVCGNGLSEENEDCDGEDLNELSCERLGFTAGPVFCTLACTIDVSACENPLVPTCGNGRKEVGEACDGDDLGLDTCEDHGLLYGALACRPDCTLDLTGCTGEDPCRFRGNGSTGCAFVAVAMANPWLDAQFQTQFGILISNPNDVAVTAVITGGGVSLSRPVAPHASEVFRLPYQEDRRLCGSIDGESHYRSGFYPAAAGQGAFFIETDGPVTAAQFNPFPDDLGGATFAYTSDGSRLIPVRDLSGDVPVMSRAGLLGVLQGGTAYNSPGILVIAATVDNTRITVDTTAHIASGSGVPSAAPGQSMTWNLDQGDTLQLVTRNDLSECPTGSRAEATSHDAALFCNQGDAYDFTGSRVTASQPVAVWGGHALAFVPYDIGAGDMLEEMMPPVSFLGNHHFVGLTKPVVIGSAQTNVIRVMATEDNTSIVFSPEVAPRTVLQANQFMEFVAQIGIPFEINPSGPILVGKFMVGEQYGEGEVNDNGDPSFGLVVPTDRFKSSHTLAVPANHSQNYLQIISLIPTDPSLEIQVNGTPITAAQYIPIGASGFGVAVLEYPHGDSPETIHVTSQDPAVVCGVEIYGYSPYQSYLLPGNW